MRSQLLVVPAIVLGVAAATAAAAAAAEAAEAEAQSFPSSSASSLPPDNDTSSLSSPTTSTATVQTTITVRGLGFPPLSLSYTGTILGADAASTTLQATCYRPTTDSSGGETQLLSGLGDYCNTATPTLLTYGPNAARFRTRSIITFDGNSDGSYPSTNTAAAITATNINTTVDPTTLIFDVSCTASAATNPLTCALKQIESGVDGDGDGGGGQQQSTWPVSIITLAQEYTGVVAITGGRDKLDAAPMVSPTYTLQAVVPSSGGGGHVIDAGSAWGGSSKAGRRRRRRWASLLMGMVLACPALAVAGLAVWL